MVETGSIRQRKKLRAKRNNTQDETTETESTKPSNSESFFRKTFVKIKPLAIRMGRISTPTILGLLSASALSSDGYAVAYFVLTICLMFLTLFLTFFSIVGTNDKTMIDYPTVYKSDGTITKEPSITVFDYDKEMATYYSTEFPLFAVGIVWFYLWTQLRPTMLVYAAYLAYRIFTHPIFRIHIWKELPNHAIQRPFGYAPLFKSNDNDDDDNNTHINSVKVIEGIEAFNNVLDDVDQDCLIIIDASATWCAPCRTMAPIFEGMAKDFHTCTFLSFDVDNSQDIAKKLEVSAMPSFFLYKNRKQLEVLRGPSPQVLRAAIQKHL